MRFHERTGPVVPPWANVRRDLDALVRAYAPGRRGAQRPGISVDV